MTHPLFSLSAPQNKAHCGGCLRAQRLCANFCSVVGGHSLKIFLHEGQAF